MELRTTHIRIKIKYKIDQLCVYSSVRKKDSADWKVPALLCCPVTHDSRERAASSSKLLLWYISALLSYLSLKQLSLSLSLGLAELMC